MKTKSLIILLSTVILTGCHTYKEYKKEAFGTYTWASEQEITFTPTIDDISKNYNIIIGIRHLYGLQLVNLPLTIKVISPSGKKIAQDYDFKIVDDQGKHVGKCAGDICDLETVIGEIKFEESGQFTFIITHRMQAEKVPGIIELGLIIDKQ